MRPSHRVRRTLGAATVLTTSALVLVLAVTACSGLPANTVQVDIVDLKFDPGTITIDPGTTVRWVNEDETAHMTVSDDFEDGSANPNAWSSDPLNPGDSFEFKFDTSGTYKYHCGVHEYMKGTVIVN